MDEILTIKRVISEEMTALNRLEESIDKRALIIIEKLESCKGKLIFSGVGKMGNVALKASATFSSLGIPAVFLSPLEAIHGGLGIFQEDDTSILISKSGETRELIEMIPFIKKKGITMIAITCNEKSILSQEAELVYTLPKVDEACILKLAPTCSTTIAMCLFDAFAVAISENKKIKKENFLELHPGGTIGEQSL